MPRLTARADIQGLRALAVLLVVLNHAAVPGLTGGYIGVDIFFVLSGYLISALLLREATASGHVSIIGFYAKRARRILPAATVVLLVTAIFATLRLSIVRADQIVDDVVWSAFFAANVHFGRQGTDYFAAELPPSPVQHFWSLAVEEQFYLLWPALLALVLVAGRRHPQEEARLQRARGRLQCLAVLVSAGCVASLAWSAVRVHESPTSAYFSTPTRAWELGAGVLLALTGRHLTRIPRRVRWAMTWAGVAAIAVAATRFDAGTPFPGWHALLPVLGTVALLAAGAGEKPVGAGRLLTVQPLRWVGDVSYSLYLWHWPFLVLGAAYAGHRLEVSENLVLVGGAVAAAAASYYLVENPFRQARALSARPRLAMLMWPAALGSVVVASVWAGGHFDRVEAAQAAAGADFDLSDVPRELRADRSRNELHNDIALALDRASVEAPIPFPVDPQLTQINSDVWERGEACSAQTEEVPHELCPAGDVDADRVVVVLGDSHANMWLPAIDALGSERGFKLIPLIKFGCTPAQVTMYRGDLGRVYTECSDWRDWAIEEISRIQPEAVVVGSHTRLRMVDGNEATLRGAAARRAWHSGMRALVERLTPLSPEVRVLGDLNYLRQSPGVCLSMPGATMATCTIEVSPRTKQVNARTAAAVKHTDAEYVDVLPLLCADDRCPFVVGSTVVYRDRQHVSRTYALAVKNQLSRRLALQF